MKQRVAIARGMAMEPDILLMDEPFAALDALTRRKMQDELLQLWEDTKFTVLFVTHSIQEAVMRRQPHPAALAASGPGEGRAQQRSAMTRADTGARRSPLSRTHPQHALRRRRSKSEEAPCAWMLNAGRGRSATRAQPGSEHDSASSRRRSSPGSGSTARPARAQALRAVAAGGRSGRPMRAPRQPAAVPDLLETVGALRDAVAQRRAAATGLDLDQACCCIGYAAGIALRRRSSPCFAIAHAASAPTCSRP